MIRRLPGLLDESVDKQSVVGTLKASGSRDPDVLYATKQVLTPGKHLKLLGICAGVGVFFTITVILAFIGIPSVLFGWWCWHFGSKNVAAVETGYSEYVGAIAPATAAV
jgi:hypothetical protein